MVGMLSGANTPACVTSRAEGVEPNHRDMTHPGGKARNWPSHAQYVARQAEGPGAISIGLGCKQTTPPHRGAREDFSLDIPL
jgi:hypothetical protein